MFFDVVLGRLFGGLGSIVASFWCHLGSCFALLEVFLLELPERRLPKRFFDVFGGLPATAEPRRTRF